MSDLNVSLIIRAIDRATGPVRRITKNFDHMAKASRRASKAFQVAANIRQASVAVERFGKVARDALKKPISEFEDFQAEMKRVQGLTKVSGVEFAALEKEARRLGRSVGEFSALDVARGMSEFGIAGRSVEEILQAIPSTLDLSSASTMALADTIGVVTGIMGGFGLAAKDTARVNDILAATFTGSKTTLASLGETMSYAGNVAKMAGVSLEETAVMAGLLGNASIEGSRAGTLLVAMITRLAGAGRGKSAKILEDMGIDASEIKDGVMAMKSPLQLLGEIKEKIKDLGQVEQIKILSLLFGREAVGGATQLMRSLGALKIKKLTDDVENANGSLTKLAKTMRSSAKNATKELDSAANSLYISVGEALDPALGKLKKTVQGYVTDLDLWIKDNKKLASGLAITFGAVALLATALGGLLVVIATLVSAAGLGALIFGIKMTGAQLVIAAVKGVAVFIASLVRMAAVIIGKTLMVLAVLTASLARAAIAALVAAAPFLAVAAAIGAITLAIIQLVKHWKELDFLEGIKGIAESLGESGILSTLGELFDPRTLLRDMGVMGGEAPGVLGGAATTLGGPQAQQLSGTLKVKIDSEGRPRVEEAATEGGWNMETETMSAGWNMVEAGI